MLSQNWRHINACDSWQSLIHAINVALGAGNVSPLVGPRARVGERNGQLVPMREQKRQSCRGDTMRGIQ